MNETYEEVLDRHRKEIHDKQRICKHLHLKCELDHGVIGRGSCTESILVNCIHCGDHVVIFGWYSKDRGKLIKAMEQGKIDLDWEKGRYDCDDHTFCNTKNPTKDYLYLKNQLKKVIK